MLFKSLLVLLTVVTLTSSLAARTFPSHPTSVLSLSHASVSHPRPVKKRRIPVPFFPRKVRAYLLAGDS